MPQDPSSAIDTGSDAAQLFALKVWEYKQGEVVSLMIHLGDRLGLYRAMAGIGPLTAAELAQRTGLHERWVLEWLRSQAAAGLVNSRDGENFDLPAEAVPVLVDEEGSLLFAAGAFHGSVVPAEAVDRLVEAFRTGVGLSYDDLGPAAAHGLERMLAPWSRVALVPSILPALDGVIDKLRSGARVVDVGCGAGVAVLSMARAFPSSTFEGIDPSHHAIELANSNLADSALTNASFRAEPASSLRGGPTYDLALTLDCLHDMPHPDEAAAAIGASLAEDGTWLIKEIRSGATWEENLRNPVLAMMYGTSVATCLSSAMSEPDGKGLGTLGLGPRDIEALVRSAGFTRFTEHDFGDPANLYYEVRP